MNEINWDKEPQIAPRTWGMMAKDIIEKHIDQNRPTHVGNDGRQFGFTIIQNCLTHLGNDK